MRRAFGKPAVQQTVQSVLVLMVLSQMWPAPAQTCRLSVAGLNRARRVTGPAHAECPAPFHTAPFGNWGVTSNFGNKKDDHQFQGWCHETYVCNNIGICWTDCRDGWYEWNSCTDDSLYRPPNCFLYNANNCTEQVSATGSNVHGTTVIDLPAACPVDVDGDGFANRGGCAGITSYSPGRNFMSLYELDFPAGDDLVQTMYFPDTPVSLECGVFGCKPAGSSWVAPIAYDSPISPAKVYAEMATAVNWGTFLDDTGVCPAATSTQTSVSAASFDGSALAAESIASAFGLGFTTETAQASSIPLPYSLAGVTVTVTDSSGASRPAPLFYISPSQINFQVPTRTTAGLATVTVARGDRWRWIGRVKIDPVAPGLFSANANGQGVAAAVAVHVAGDGSQTWELVFQCGNEPGSCRPVEVDLGTETDQAVLLLFGTGIRGATSSEVTVKLAGVETEVLYAGPQPTFVGLDQVNVRLPPSLRGRGDLPIELSVDGKQANVVTINIR